MNKWIFHQNGVTRTSLSATVTRVSNFVEDNVCMCVFYMVKAPRPGGFSHSLQKHIRLNYVNRNALSMFKALNKGCK